MTSNHLNHSNLIRIKGISKHLTIFFLDISSWWIGILWARCLSLCPGGRRFDLNQEKNKIFLSDIKTTISGSNSCSVEGRCQFVWFQILYSRFESWEQTKTTLLSPLLSSRSGTTGFYIGVIFPCFTSAAKEDTIQLFSQISSNGFHNHYDPFGLSPEAVWHKRIHCLVLDIYIYFMCCIFIPYWLNSLKSHLFIQ